MGLNICPCMSLGKGVKILAIIDGSLAGILAVLTTAFIVLASLDHKNLEPGPVPFALVMTVLAIFLIACFLDIGLALLLFTGAKNRNPTNCTIWVAITVIIVGFTIASLLYNLIRNRVGLDFAILGPWVGFKIYESIVVHTFVQHVRNGEGENGVVFSGPNTRLLQPGHGNPNPHYSPIPQ